MAISTKRTLETKRNTTMRVVLQGTAPIMFDRYPGNNSTKLQWWQKLYLSESNVVSLPIINIMSFLSAQNTMSAPKRLRDVREYKKICNACLSFVSIESPQEPYDLIPFLRNGKPIVVGNFDTEVDEQSGIFLSSSVARLEKGIPNPVERPTLPLPWSLEFNLHIFKNKEIDEQEINNLFEEGGVAIGLGTFRGVYGKFKVADWHEIKE